MFASSDDDDDDDDDESDTAEVLATTTMTTTTTRCVARQSSRPGRAAARVRDRVVARLSEEEEETRKEPAALVAPTGPQGVVSDAPTPREAAEFRDECGPAAARRALLRPDASSEGPTTTTVYVSNVPARVGDALFRQFAEEVLGEVGEVRVVRKAQRVFAFVETTHAGAVDKMDGAELMGEKLVARRARERPSSSGVVKGGDGDPRERGGFRKDLLAAHLEKQEQDRIERQARRRKKDRDEYEKECGERDARRKSIARAEGHFGHGFTSSAAYPGGPKRPRLHSGYAHFDV